MYVLATYCITNRVHLCCQAQGGAALHGPKYHLIPVDLRLPPTGSLQHSLTQPALNGISRPIMTNSLPTLILFECVLVYMTPETSSALIEWFVDYFAKESTSDDSVTLSSIIYEMFGLQDSFGKVMLNNLKVRPFSHGYICF